MLRKTMEQIEEEMYPIDEPNIERGECYWLSIRPDHKAGHLFWPGHLRAAFITDAARSMAKFCGSRVYVWSQTGNIVWTQRSDGPHRNNPNNWSGYARFVR